MELNYLSYHGAHGTRSLSHHGVKGMKWGVRRYQNADGSLTSRGKNRYAKDDYHADYKKAHDKKSVKYMSDQELRDRNNRLNAERQYESFTKKKGRAKKFVQSYIATAGMITGAVAATAVYAKYAKKSGDLAGKALEKIGDRWAIKI